jgi:hypothetical protein
MEKPMPEKIYRYNAHRLPFSFPAGTEIHGGNFSQDTLFICPDEVIIYGGNHENVEYPNGTVMNGIILRRTDYCYHLCPDRVLPVEEDNCRHVVDTITFDGGTLAYIRENTVVR